MAMKNDALYSDDFKQYILDFMKLTQNEFSLMSIVNVVHILQTSAILNVLAKDPTNEDARACLSDFIAKTPTIPQSFGRSWITLASATANINRNILGNINSINVKLNLQNIEPRKTLTNTTASAKRALLQQDIANAESHTVHQHRAPTEIKLILSDDVMNQIINSQVMLYECISEGYRQNGKEPDQYIKTQLKPKY